MIVLEKLKPISEWFLIPIEYENNPKLFLIPLL
jgi:hypothetical protein